MPLLAGVDGCKAGWLCLTRESTADPVGASMHRSATALFQQEPPPDIFCIDIPIGLTERGSRRCDVESRKLLAPLRSSSVFPAPLRQLLAASSYREANDLRRAVDGVGISQQAWAIYPKIREVDELLCSDPALRERVYEVHPEICFFFWNGARAMEHPKRSIDGHLARRALVEAHFGPRAFQDVRASTKRSAVADDDILDAFAALWTAERILNGEARTVPDIPELDANNLPMRIVY